MIHESLLYRKKSEHPNWQSARINTEVDMWRTAWHIRERNSQHNVNIHQRLTMYAAWIPSVCTVQKYSKLKPKFQLPTPGKWPVKSVVGNCYVNASPRTLPRLCLHWRNEMWYRTALSVDRYKPPQQSACIKWVGELTQNQRNYRLLQPNDGASSKTKNWGTRQSGNPPRLINLMPWHEGWCRKVPP